MPELDMFRPALDAISPAEVVEPPMPMAVVLQEANALCRQLQRGDTWPRMLAVGADPIALDDLIIAVAATRQAQSRWVILRDRDQPRMQHDREQLGADLRVGIVVACRWNIWNEPDAQATLDTVAQGIGVPDLIQDLLDLAALLDRHEAAFDADEAFDAPAQAEAARCVAEQLTAEQDEPRATTNHDATKALRDRAYTYLAALVSELREAGRDAFRKEPQRAAAFGSACRRWAQDQYSPSAYAQRSSIHCRRYTTSSS